MIKHYVKKYRAVLLIWITLSVFFSLLFSTINEATLITSNVVGYNGVVQLSYKGRHYNISLEKMNKFDISLPIFSYNNLTLNSNITVHNKMPMKIDKIVVRSIFGNELFEKPINQETELKEIIKLSPYFLISVNASDQIAYSIQRLILTYVFIMVLVLLATIACYFVYKYLWLNIYTNLSSKSNNILIFAFVLILSYLIFYYTFYVQRWQDNVHWVSDVPIHADMVEAFARDNSFPVYSIWYILVYYFSYLAENNYTVVYTSIFLLTALIGIKYLITIQIISKNLPSISVATWAVSLLLCMPVISYYSGVHIYLGNISPNQWHNSTLILAMPVNLILFDFATRKIQLLKITDAILVGLLFILSILCKPNFALAFLPVLVLSLVRVNIKQRYLYKLLLKIGIIITCSCLILLFQYYYTFIHNDLFVHPSKTIFAPFLVWGTYSSHIWLSCLLSLAFPIVVAGLYFRNALMDIQLIISWGTLFVAVIMMATLAEYPNYSAGNYFWGAIASNFIVFLYSVRLLLFQRLDWKRKFCKFIFSLHVISGIYFLCSFFTNQTSLIM